MLYTWDNIYISNADDNDKQTLPLYSVSNIYECAEATVTLYHVF